MPATPPVESVERPSRALKTMLFADFAGYSRLHDAFAPLFQTRFLEIGARIIEQSTVKPLGAKTWGDAVYAVFESPVAGAEFALRFLERMLETDWTATGLPSTSQIRIALHAGADAERRLAGEPRRDLELAGGQPLFERRLDVKALGDRRRHEPLPGRPEHLRIRRALRELVRHRGG